MAPSTSRSGAVTPTDTAVRRGQRLGATLGIATALSDHRWDQLRALLAEDVEVTVAGRSHRGRHDVLAWLSDLAGEALSVHFERIDVRGESSQYLHWWAASSNGAWEGTSEVDLDAAGRVARHRVQRRVASSRRAPGIRLELDPPLAWLFFSRPEKRNAADQTMLRAMRQAVAEVAADPDLRSLVLAGDDPDFCAGEDVRGFEFITARDATAFLEAPMGLIRDLEALEKPVVIAVQGNALGLGSELLVVADYVCASPAAQFGFAEIDHGAVPATLLVRGLDTVGRRRGTWLALSGDRIGVDAAVEARLVHEVSDDPIGQAETAAREMSSWSPAAVRLVKVVTGADANDEVDRAREFLPAVLLGARANLEDRLEDHQPDAQQWEASPPVSLVVGPPWPDGPLIVDLDGFTGSELDDLLALERRRWPSVGVVTQRCTGASLAAAMAVDLLVSTSSAVFGQPGAWADVAWRRARGLVGRRRATYFLTASRLVDANQALRWGLASHVTDDDPTALAHSILETMMKRSPTAVATILAQCHRGATGDYATARLSTTSRSW